VAAATSEKPLKSVAAATSEKPTLVGTETNANSSNPRKTETDPSNSTVTEPSLLAFGRAERALFPQTLRGLRPQFSFDADADWAVTEPAKNLGEAKEKLLAPWYKDLDLPEIYPNVDGRILTYLEFFRSQADGKTILRTWAKKRGKYESSLVQTLTKSGVPRDIVWQSLVESAHNPTIKSPAGAAGLWQFMPETARTYGLTVDRWIDERLDPERATEAAARMMNELYRRFGNWELSLAAYNMGEAGLLRAIRKYNTNDFWALSRYEAGLPWETSLYVPRIVATTIAMNNLRAFGIEDLTVDEPLLLDSVVLNAGQPLSAIAKAINIPLEQLAQLNPQILLGRLPPKVGSTNVSVRIYVPKGKGELLRSRLSRTSGPEPDLEGYATKRGESVEAIALARGIPLDDIKSINRISEGEVLEPGTVLLLPRVSSGGFQLQSAEDERIAVVPPEVTLADNQRRVFYRVSAGDTLSSIADAFSVTRTELLETNSLDPSAKLQDHMLLQVLVPKDFKSKAVHFEEESSMRVLVAGSVPFLDYFEGLRGNERIVVQAKAKDTLASIGARHGVTVGMMERINHRSRRDALSPGESVVVYVRRSGGQERVGSAQ
jgi:membrane-bound lytic murein transglycosylase D